MHNAKIIRARAFAPVHELHHERPASLNDPRVAVGLPNRPRTNHARIAPSRAEIPAVLKGIRTVAGKGAAGTLRFHHFAQPLGVERGDIGIQRGAMRVNLRVTHPAETLVALRTVRRQI